MRCECGRRALAFARPRKKSSRRARAGRPGALKGHDLCGRCYSRLCDAHRARGLAVKEV